MRNSDLDVGALQSSTGWSAPVRSRYGSVYIVGAVCLFHILACALMVSAGWLGNAVLNGLFAAYHIIRLNFMIERLDDQSRSANAESRPSRTVEESAKTK